MKCTLTKQIFSILAFAIIIIITFQIFFIYILSNIQQRKTKSHADEIIKNIGFNLNFITDNIVKTATTFSFSSAVQQYIYSDDYNNKLKQLEYISDLIYLSRKYNEALMDVIIITNKGNSYSLIGYMNKNIEEYILNNFAKQHFDNNKKNFTFFTQPELKNTYIVYTMPIFNTKFSDSYGKKLGTIAVVCNTENIQKLINTNNDIYIEIIDTNTQESVISNNQLIYKYRTNLFTFELKGTNLKIQGRLSHKYYSNEYNLIMFYIIFLLILLVSILTFIGYMLRKIIIKPINILNQEINLIKYGDSNQKLSISTNQINNEIGLIALHINKMLDKIYLLNKSNLDAQAKLYEMELSKKRTHLYAYQSQINPHFLYNMLQCMRGIALMNDMYEIANICTCMADIFRYSIKGSDYVNLEQEIDIVRKYLYITSIRFQNKITYNIQIDNKYNHTKIPKMILQPIVENAIFHGLEPLDTKGHVSIFAYDENSKLYIIVKDNGIGISAEKLKQIKQQLDRKQLKTPFSDINQNLAILNIHNKIRLYTSDEYGLSIDSSKNGTIVTIKLPLIL